MKLDVKACALAAGLFWGLALFLLTWWVIMFDGESEQKTLIGMVYRGHTFTAMGSVIGLLWALVDGLICGAIFAWLYNLMAPARREAGGQAAVS